ncbi:hypothetical protein lacNasYZ02_03810 [Lactobacillus nasalidis]|nr:hypothetical protein lacNasYZ02_03810 [Lactobacillus nasalidis]
MQLGGADAWRVFGVEGKDADTGDEQEDEQQKEPFDHPQNGSSLFAAVIGMKAGHPRILLL